MKRSSAAIPYEKLYLVYDHLMKRVNYKEWAKYIVDLTSGYTDKNSSVLELAGGNGKLSSHLKKFNNYILTDKSLEMLSASQSPVLKICCDMTAIPIKKKFDLIFSTFDSINYLLSKKQLIKLFCEVKFCLKDDGVFTFDASLEKNSYDHIKDPLREGEINNIRYSHTSEFNSKTKIHKNIFRIFPDDGPEIKEVHKQKIYSFEDYFILLDKAGLYVVDCFEAFTFWRAKSTSLRAQFIVKKKGN